MSRFITLYSGSSGNASVIEQDGHFLMVDVGKSCSMTLGAMVKAGLSPRGLEGILVTHEHIDHVRGLQVLLKRVQVPVYASEETLRVLLHQGLVAETARLVPLDDQPHQVGCFTVRAFPVSHDAAGCRGYRVVTPSGRAAAIATDIGVMSDAVFDGFNGAHMVAIEANYDKEMLRLGRYPAYLKRRIQSETGHLSNEECAQVVAELLSGGCTRIALCHLSEENNEPGKVRQAIEQVLQRHNVAVPLDCEVQIARRHEPGDWMEF